MDDSFLDDINVTVNAGQLRISEDYVRQRAYRAGLDAGRADVALRHAIADEQLFHTNDAYHAAVTFLFCLLATTRVPYEPRDVLRWRT